MRTIAAAVLLLAVACQARPEGDHVNIADRVQQLNHTLVTAANDVRVALHLPTQDEALNVITEESNRLKTKVEEIAANLKKVAEKHQGTVSEQISTFARTLNETFVNSATSLNLEQQVNSLQTSLSNLGHQWQEFSAKVQPSAEAAWTSVQSALADAAEKTKDATTSLHNSIQSAIQKAN